MRSPSLSTNTINRAMGLVTPGDELTTFVRVSVVVPTPKFARILVVEVLVATKVHLKPTGGVPVMIVLNLTVSPTNAICVCGGRMNAGATSTVSVAGGRLTTVRRLSETTTV